jgi:hypothetical protein
MFFENVTNMWNHKENQNEPPHTGAIAWVKSFIASHAEGQGCMVVVCDRRHTARNATTTITSGSLAVLTNAGSVIQAIDTIGGSE